MCVTPSTEPLAGETETAPNQRLQRTRTGSLNPAQDSTAAAQPQVVGPTPGFRAQILHSLTVLAR